MDHSKLSAADWNTKKSAALLSFVKSVAQQKGSRVSPPQQCLASHKCVHRWGHKKNWVDSTATPSDFYLFGTLKDSLPQHQHANDEALQNTVYQWLQTEESNGYWIRIHAIVQRWKKTAANSGDYSETQECCSEVLWHYFMKHLPFYTLKTYIKLRCF